MDHPRSRSGHSAPSLKSDQHSKGEPLDFKDWQDETPASRSRSGHSDHSKGEPLDFKDLQDETPVLREETSESLHYNRHTGDCQKELQTSIKKQLDHIFEEGFAPLQQLYTELHMTEGGASQVDERIVTCADMFKQRPDSKRPLRTVLTVGEAGVGKTVLTQKFSLDWAEGKDNQDIDLLFHFTFKEINVMKDQRFSLVQLLHHCFPQTTSLHSFNNLKLLFIFDGLDECRLPLNFNWTRVLAEPTESASVDVLLVNLIKGSLLPSAFLWITSRPAAANQIESLYVSMVTEVRGFSDPQKEQYFMKRFRDEQQATAVIDHIKKSRVLYSMCYSPMFCWILSNVLENMMKVSSIEDLPLSLTPMYIHFLMLQIKAKSLKYDGLSEEDSPWTPDNKKMVNVLEQLAFDQLQDGNLIYEHELRKRGLDAAEITRYSGLFTEVFGDEPGQDLKKPYSFIHLSVQEFLSALHVHQTFYNDSVNLLSIETKLKNSPADFYCSAVDQALLSPNGHLDLLLRFLLGLSLSTNQRLLQGLLTFTGNEETNQKTIQYIEREIYEPLSAERIVTLFICLYELNDHSLVQKIQRNIREERLRPDDMSNALWTAVASLLLSSKDLEEFDLKKYHPSEEIFLKLLKVMEASTKAMLSQCNLTARCCGPLSSVISSDSCALKELDLSFNNIQDSGVEQLCVGLKSATCRLEVLSLQSCSLSEQSCLSLALVLKSSSRLKDLNLSDNTLKDTGVKYLSIGLEVSHCGLQKLRLSNCEISDEAVASLASALTSGSPGLKEVDLDLNNKISADSEHLLSLQIRVDTLRVDVLIEDLKKYHCDISLDRHTAPPELCLSKSDHSLKSDGLHRSESFEGLYQLHCITPLTGRCFWVVEWRGVVDIAVSYNSIRDMKNSQDGRFGENGLSWSLRIKAGYSVCHNKEKRVLSSLVFPAQGGRVAVYLDWSEGLLSFYEVNSDRLSLLHSYSCSFTEPLFAGFGLHRDFSPKVTLVDFNML